MSGLSKNNDTIWLATIQFGSKSRICERQKKNNMKVIYF